MFLENISVCLSCKVVPAGNSIGVSCFIQKLADHTCTAGHDWNLQQVKSNCKQQAPDERGVSLDQEEHTHLFCVMTHTSTITQTLNVLMTHLRWRDQLNSTFQITVQNTQLNQTVTDSGWRDRESTSHHVYDKSSASACIRLKKT